MHERKGVILLIQSRGRARPNRWALSGCQKCLNPGLLSLILSFIMSDRMSYILMISIPDIPRAFFEINWF